MTQGFGGVEDGVSIDGNPKEQFIQMMHDASEAIATSSATDLKVILEHARAIVSSLDEEERADATDQIFALENKLAELNS